MWLAIKVLRLFAKSLVRIAVALEELRDLYRLDLATRGIILTNPDVKDEVEIIYGVQEHTLDV
jgi:hypothetical protein